MNKHRLKSSFKGFVAKDGTKRAWCSYPTAVMLTTGWTLNSRREAITKHLRRCMEPHEPKIVRELLGLGQDSTCNAAEFYDKLQDPLGRAPFEIAAKLRAHLDSCDCTHTQEVVDRVLGHDVASQT